MGIKGIIVVFLNRKCLAKAREEITGEGVGFGAGLLTTLRSKDEKLQFDHLLQQGKLAVYHRNLTSS